MHCNPINKVWILCDLLLNLTVFRPYSAYMKKYHADSDRAARSLPHWIYILDTVFFKQKNKHGLYHRPQLNILMMAPTANQSVSNATNQPTPASYTSCSQLPINLAEKYRTLLHVRLARRQSQPINETSLSHLETGTSSAFITLSTATCRRHERQQIVSYQN